MTEVLFGIGVLLLLLAVHPFVTYPLSLLAIRAVQRPRAPTMPSQPLPLSFAICMCAYNEEPVIERKILNLLDLRREEPDLEILVYDDASTDRTAEILEKYADRIDLHLAEQRRGKTYGMNLLSAKARADILVFTDANVMLDRDCLKDLRRHFADTDIGCVCGTLTYTNGADSVTAASGALYWRFEEAIKRLEAQTGSTMGADGAIFAVRRALRRAPPEHIIDDMYVSFMVLCDGYRVVQVPDARAYEESVTSAREEFNRKVRIACQAFNVHRLLWPHIRRLPLLEQYKYVSHKLLRWLSIYFLSLGALVLCAALVSAGLGYVAGLLVLAALLVILLGALGAVKLFARGVDLLLALSGTGLGVWRSLRGERYQTWTPATSIRRS